MFNFTILNLQNQKYYFCNIKQRNVRKKKKLQRIYNKCYQSNKILVEID